MLRKIAEKLLRHYGVDVVDAEEQTEAPHPVNGAPVSPSFPHEHLKAIGEDPLNPHLHARYAAAAASAGLRYLAYAEIKTAEQLSGRSCEFDLLKKQCLDALPQLVTMNHNQHYRLASLASEIRSRADGEIVSVLDVGGSDGRLAAFIPEHFYCLAEPSFNAISGSKLPFSDRSFDFVVSCHVLEHIPPDARSGFLDQLLAKATRGVVLLNPFQGEQGGANEVDQFIFDVTRADWAKEHLECTLPQLDDIRKYAAAKGLLHSIKPNGTLMTTIPFVFVDYFAARAGGCVDELAKLNRFVNERFAGMLDSAEYPIAYLVYLSRE
jgi:hypothetical protein